MWQKIFSILSNNVEFRRKTGIFSKKFAKFKNNCINCSIYQEKGLNSIKCENLHQNNVTN